MEKLTLTVEGLNAPQKIRDYLKRYGFSTSLIAIVKYDMVRLNNIAVHMRELVKNGDVIEIDMPEEEPTPLIPYDINLDVIYEDEHFIAVNKPISMPTHPSRGNSLPTLANALRHYFGKPFVYRSITRLDRDTSGIVLVAKDRITASRLSALMKSGKIIKKYTALVSGVPYPAEGRIDAPIKRESEDSIIRVVAPDGKNAVTNYSTVSVNADGNAILLVNPITGRTHQIRVHMAYIGHPLVADFLYGNRADGDTYKLHCSALELPHPYTGEALVLRSQPDFI